MKLKYKKIVLVVTTFTMLIGCMIFTTVDSNKNVEEQNPIEQQVDGQQNQETENSEQKENNVQEVNNEKNTEDTQVENNTQDVNNEKNTEDTQEKTNTQEVNNVEKIENTQEEQNEGIALEKSTNQQINQLVSNYFKASVNCDMETLGTLVNDVSILKKEELKLKYEFVEDIKNVECYFAEGLSENKYLVYVYSEVKFKDVDTMAPGLSRLTIVKTEEENYQIFFGADKEMEQFVKKADNSESVQKLVKKVGLKMEEALSNDSKLKELNEKMTVTNTKEQKQEKEKTKDKTKQEATTE